MQCRVPGVSVCEYECVRERESVCVRECVCECVSEHTSPELVSEDGPISELHSPAESGWQLG